MAKVKHALAKVISVVASVTLAVGLMPLPAIAVANNEAPNENSKNGAALLAAGALSVGEAAQGETPLQGTRAENGEVSVGDWGSQQSALKYDSHVDLVVLNKDIDCPADGRGLRIIDNNNITLDLNGYTLNRNLASR